MSGTGTYLDLIDVKEEDEFEPVVLEEDGPEVEPAARRCATDLDRGTTDMSRHIDAFKGHTWKIYREPGTARFAEIRTWSEPSPPAVACRDALPGEVPTTAVTAWTNATAAGWPVRMTFAESGDERWTSVRGKCECGALVPLYKATGFMHPHRPPSVTEKTACSGTALNWLGVCQECGSKAKVLKNGGLGKHYLKPVQPIDCPHVEGPAQVIPGVRRPGVRSLVVRVAGLGVGLWIDDGFHEGWLRGAQTWVRVGSDEFQAACRRPREETS